MSLDKNKIKEKLDKEKLELEGQLKDIARLNPETGEWEAVPEVSDHIETDQNDMADRFEDFESRSSMLKVLEKRWNSVLSVLKGINKDSFGKCTVCKKNIESDRLEANPAASTCKKHMN